MKRKKQDDGPAILKARENRDRVISLHRELLATMLTRDYSDETKASLRRGGEAYIATLRRGF